MNAITILDGGMGAELARRGAGNLHIPAGWTLDNEVATGRRELSLVQYVLAALRWVELGAN